MREGRASTAVRENRGNGQCQAEPGSKSVVKATRASVSVGIRVLCRRSRVRFANNTNRQRMRNGSIAESAPPSSRQVWTNPAGSCPRSNCKESIVYGKRRAQGCPMVWRTRNTSRGGEKCPRDLLFQQAILTHWLQDAIENGRVAGPWENGFPRYAWHRVGERRFCARLTNSGLGEYKGWPISTQEWPPNL